MNPSVHDDELERWPWRHLAIMVIALIGISSSLIIRFGLKGSTFSWNFPLIGVLAFGGVPLVFELLNKVRQGEFGTDLLAGISVVTAVIQQEYLAGAIVVLMLSGGETLERRAMSSASSVLKALASRMPSVAHRKEGSAILDVKLDQVEVGHTLLVYPHEICPVDGTVVAGHGVMNEAFLTGEPFEVTKAPGTAVISGAMNGANVLTIVATRLVRDSRYAKIAEVMRESAENRPRIRRLGDQLGAIYTPVAVVIAALAWVFSGESTRFLSVLVIATPCPLLIGIPVVIIGSISLAARRSIIIKNPAALERISECRTAIFDKTGTLTYGEPVLTEQSVAPGFDPKMVLRLVASVELYSKHPLARAILEQAKVEGIPLDEASEVSEPPGKGLRALVGTRQVEITSRRKFLERGLPGAEHLSPIVGGLECVVIIDDRLAATYRLRDAPRKEGHSFIHHLGPKHHFHKVMIISGDRESEVRYLADEVGIKEIHAEQTPEQKLVIVRAETAMAKTLYVGDGINDAPAMMGATVGMAIGQNSDITAEAADVVVMDNSLGKVDEFMHIGRRMRSIALQSAIGGMALSLGGMILASLGYLTPVAGAVCQEVIDVLAVLNALRAALPPRVISDIGKITNH
ncbi:MAG: cadmium-translocating P-type ATPase [Verrucomicrobiaceae bacterium]|nr:MAG: cadmium-translocating P-type ATPase [Verrucomicrobiaceae bacterium]